MFCCLFLPWNGNIGYIFRYELFMLFLVGAGLVVWKCR